MINNKKISTFLKTSLDSIAVVSPETHIISSDDLYIIQRGGMYVNHDWLDPQEVATLRHDIARLRNSGRFIPSGLSNRVAGDSNFFGSNDRLTCTITPELPGEEYRARTEAKLFQMKTRLEQILSIKGLELAEQYYSVSPKGSSLACHMDERHEETKGDKAWESETRRSISWILYLNDPSWKSGGELRGYCRHSSNICGADEGNLQVGWLPTREKGALAPVFLDSWVKTRIDSDPIHSEERTLQWLPLSALYRLAKDASRDYLTDPFGPDSSTWPSDRNLEPDGFASALASHLSPEHRESFMSVESIANVPPVEVMPTGGTLVLFDSASVPHEVLVTQTADRLAMAGWFHEPTQLFPEWYGT